MSHVYINIYICFSIYYLPVLCGLSAQDDLISLRVEKAEIEGAFLCDKEITRELHKRMIETGKQVKALKADVERLRKEARRRKGMLAIARVQLSTK